MALVVVLALIVLLTAAVLAFFVQASSSRQTEASRAHRTEADILARSGCDYVVAQFLQEIANPANSSADVVGTTTIYSPIANTNAVPQRNLSASISPGDTNFFNLNRQSVAASDTNASGDNTATPAANGRLVTTNQWNKPLLLGAGFSTNQLPSWVYVTASGGLTNAASTKVIGRFAYNVYDLGGMLNVNAAGYPGNLPFTPQQLAGLKGTLAGADLTQLPGLSQAAIDQLIAFRNPGAPASVAAYTNCVADSARSGFLSSVVTNAAGVISFTNNYFSSRQDLLRYAATQNTNLTIALPHLTHFSRSMNAPSWKPEAPAVSPTNPNIPAVCFPGPATITHYRDDGTSETYPAKAGDSLIQRRFSLKKLAWLTYNGPASGIPENAIRACFGLHWNPTEYRWEYVGDSGGDNPQLSVKMLNEVAVANREPNFFELLQAGILEGSTGVSYRITGIATGYDPAKDNYYGNVALDGNKTLQILRIGANIIDCADSDNYPTIIGLGSGDPLVGGGAYEVAGIEDLPYFYAISKKGLRQTEDTGNTPKDKRLVNGDLVMAPVLFNPHRAPATATTPGPGKVQVNVSGTLRTVKWGTGKILFYNPNKSLSGLPPIDIQAASFSDFRDGPKPMRNGGANNALANVVPYVTPPPDGTEDYDIQVFKIYSYTSGLPYQYDSSLPVDGTQNKFRNAVFRATIDSFIVRLQYLVSDGSRLKTYSVFAGNEALPITGWQGGETDGQAPEGYVTDFGRSDNSGGGINQRDLKGTEYGVLLDPRANRFGPLRGRWRNIDEAPFLVKPTQDASELRGWFSALWAEAGKQTPIVSSGDTIPVNAIDSDGVIRPSDGWLGGGSANPYRALDTSVPANNDRRPVILQRPFESVGELSYVFRDAPWKSLSFFDASSGDAGLLDLFTLADEPAVTAGRVDLNSRQVFVRQALLAGTAQAPDESAPLPGTAPATLAAALHSYSYDSGGNVITTAMKNRADLSRFMSDQSGSVDAAGLNSIKWRRESIVRTLAGSSNDRTWTFFIDVVAQTGGFRSNGTSATDFIVRGEQHYWVSVAIDRYSGKIVDRQTEVVHE